MPAFPDACKAGRPPPSVRNPFPGPSLPATPSMAAQRRNPDCSPPAAYLVRTCVHDPAAQSVRAVACRSAQEGVGNAGCPRTRSRVRKVESTRVSHHGYAGTPGIPARSGFNGFLRALPGDRAFLSPSLADKSANLTPASRRQDHTTSPSASGALVLCTLRVHRIPPRVRDDRDTPLEWDETERIAKLICFFGKPEYFCKRGWTGRANHPPRFSGRNLNAHEPHRAQRWCCIGRAGCPSADAVRFLKNGVSRGSPLLRLTGQIAAAQPAAPDRPALGGVDHHLPQP